MFTSRVARARLVPSLLPLLALLGAGLVACGGAEDGGGGRGLDLGRGADGAGDDSSGGGPDGDDDGITGGGPLPTGDCVVKQRITKSTTWSPAACPNGYLIKYSLEVRGSGVELHLEPGTRVRVETGAYLTIEDDAAIVARGTAAQKVVFDGVSGAAASWPGLRIVSGSAQNELSHVVIRNAGNKSDRAGALVLAEQGAAKLADVSLQDNERFGLVVAGQSRILGLDRVTFRRNAEGAGWVGVPHVEQLRGDGNVFEDNGANNGVLVEATSSYKIVKDTSWPSIAPAAYRIVGQGGQSGGVVDVEAHLTIEAGAVFEMTGGSGFLMDGGNSGLHAVGTSDAKITFRGVSGSSWGGLTFGESTWSDNRLEHVVVTSAVAAPSWGFYGTGNNATRKAGILLGYNFNTQVVLTVKDFSIDGPNAAPADIAVKGSSSLTQEGAISGTGNGGALEIEAF